MNAKSGMSAATAKTIEFSIIALCVLALVMVFQPFSLRLYSIGAGLVVLGGLAFNLVPQCVPGKPLAGVIRAGIVVIVVLLIVAALAIGSAYLYGAYLR
ncbi:MAG: hypothetical protein U1F68_11095 [Gammaproteobacteria bacterium]